MKRGSYTVFTGGDACFPIKFKPMPMLKLKEATNFYYLPVVGILLFMVLYAFASTFYPGGSQADANSIGFDWVHNYTCDLFKPIALNGVENPSTTYAMVAMVILCSSMTFFFYLFSIAIPMTFFWQKMVQITGTITMVTGILIFTSWHNLMINLTSIFGLLILIGIIRGLAINKHRRFLWTGAFCTGVLIFNNGLYYLEYYDYLPLIQKITFVIVLLWVMGINIKLAQQVY